MSDIIQLLPDAVASQIAAGEVIQRPASAVKELLENAIDAGSSRIKLFIRDAGKTLIQITDDGIGMSETDARLCFERHATSKIRSVDDLFTLHTMGFRGEALASIAAIAQVELKTKKEKDDAGTQIIIEGSEVISQLPCSLAGGTSISVKNLFYNVPARRNFLKSNPVETRHIIEEFTRVALANPEISFSMTHNDAAVFDLRGGNFRQRIASVFGNIYNERLVPVEEETSIVSLSGFVGKPEFAKKVRGEQYFFVNNRFVKDAYLNHAVTAAFESMIPKDCFPSYFIRIEIDPSHIDVNIHPTKTEIKFDDEKSVYAIMRAAVKRALGKFSISPAIDFDLERSFDVPLDKMNQRPVAPVIQVTPGYNPFVSTRNDRKEPAHTPVADWNRLNAKLAEVPVAAAEIPVIDFDSADFVQLFRQYILIVNGHEVLLADQQRSHEQVLYEKFRKVLGNNNPVTQQQLFPQPVEFTPNETAVIDDMLPVLREMGFDISSFGSNTFIINGAPEEVTVGSEKQILLGMVDQFIHQRDVLHLEQRDNIARALAKQLSVKTGQSLTNREIRKLMQELMACSNPLISYTGKTIITKIDQQALSNLMTEKNRWGRFNDAVS